MEDTFIYMDHKVLDWISSKENKAASTMDHKIMKGEVYI